MAALDAPPEGGRPPSIRDLPDAPAASAAAGAGAATAVSSEVASASASPSASPSASARLSPRPVPLPLGPREAQRQTDAFPDFPPLPNRRLPSPHNGRSLSLAHLSGPIKRKPLSSTASPVAVRFSLRGSAHALADLPRPEQRFARSCSLDSPTLYEFPDKRSLLATTNLLNTVDWPASPESSSLLPSPIIERFAQRERPAADPGYDTPAAAQTPELARSEDGSVSAERSSLATRESAAYDLEYLYPIPDSPESQAAKYTTPVHSHNTTAMSMFSRKSPPPHLDLGSAGRDEQQQQHPPASAASLDQSNLNKPLPKSPGSSKLGAFFGWAASPSPSATEFSDKGFSPLPSPSSPKAVTAVTESYGTPTTGKSPAFPHAAEKNPLHYCESYLQTPPTNTNAAPSVSQLEEMEEELKAISAELAASIRREMDLEDLVETLQERLNNPQAPGKRTSDYFSDSGYSSAKVSEYDQAREEIASIQRRAEQEKAQLRLELTNKVQDERSKRRLLDQQIQELSKKASQIDVAQLNDSDASERVKELESMCEDLSRKLSEEREAKNNFEGLLEALRGELETASNERDNLRDEVVPQLRARVEGLEAEASEHAKLAYDASKIQQELQLLRSENEELRQSGTRMSMALSRSASVTDCSPKKPRAFSISRSSTTAARNSEPREVLAERLKDVEAQRDALHSALKNLLERQELQNRENSKRIRQLEMERDRLLAASPKKVNYEREVSKLRDEINVLRRRAEEAMEQKWQVEKGLSGLKMDLDRAEEEIASLRSLLREKDILIPETFGRYSIIHAENAAPVTSASLEKAYQDLQAAYTEALERIKALEESVVSEEKTQLAIQRLEQSLSMAISDRDFARTEAAAYRDQLESLREQEKQHLDAERHLADQLDESTRRVEELAGQVRAQLEANAALRTRLADAIARGEAEQRVSTERIADMQSRLRVLEEQVVAAQTGAEERVARHEEELARLKEAHNSQLQRLRDAPGMLRSPRLFPPKSPLSPMFTTASVNLQRRSAHQQLQAQPSPALSPSPSSAWRMSTPLLSPHGPRHPAMRRSISAMTAAESSSSSSLDLTAQVGALRARVAQLEAALAAADAEMQAVVGRMNEAQMEVLRLQEEREEAVRETRRLQRALEEETMKVFEQRFRSLTTTVG